MQRLLNDIELDIQELKFLIQAISGDANPALRVVAKRNISQMQERLGMLMKQLNEEPAPAPVIEDAVAPIARICTEESDCEVPIVAPVVSEHAPSVVAPTASILAERIKPATDLRHAISLNDSFRFTRELFDGDVTRMNRIVSEIGQAQTLDKALEIYMSTVCPNEENEASVDFKELLKKYFN